MHVFIKILYIVPKACIKFTHAFGAILSIDQSMILDYSSSCSLIVWSRQQCHPFMFLLLTQTPSHPLITFSARYHVSGQCSDLHRDQLWQRGLYWSLFYKYIKSCLMLLAPKFVMGQLVVPHMRTSTLQFRSFATVGLSLLELTF